MSVIAQGNELVGAVRRGILALRTGRRLRVSEVKVKIPPKYSARLIARIRKERLNVSQPVMGKLMGVAPATIRSWEQGQRIPTPMACRLLQLADEKPEVLVAIAGSALR